MVCASKTPTRPKTSFVQDPVHDVVNHQDSAELKVLRTAFQNPHTNRRFGTKIGPQTGRTQAKNARDGARKPEQTDSDRFRIGFGVFPPRCGDNRFVWRTFICKKRCPRQLLRDTDISGTKLPTSITWLVSDKGHVLQ